MRMSRSVLRQARTATVKIEFDDGSIDVYTIDACKLARSLEEPESDLFGTFVRPSEPMIELEIRGILRKGEY